MLAFGHRGGKVSFGGWKDGLRGTREVGGEARVSRVQSCSRPASMQAAQGRLESHFCEGGLDLAFIWDKDLNQPSSLYYRSKV